MKKKKIDLDYEVGSGNVFADLGFPNAEEMLAKAELAYQINSLIKKKKLTQKKAAELLAIDRPKIVLLSQGKLSSFSLERLSHFLTMLRQDTVPIQSKRKTPVSVGLTSIDNKIRCF